MTATNTIPPALTQQDIKRFKDHYSYAPGQGPKGDCWEWQFKRGGSGHARFSVNSTLFAAHRVAFYLATGIWSHVFICHRCDNPPCGRPDHLFEGTHADNTLDMVQKGRQSKGTNVHLAKLNDDLVREILGRLVHGETCYKLGPEYGVRSSEIKRIRKGATWKHIERPDSPLLGAHTYSRSMRGEDQPHSVLKEADVILIRELYKQGGHSHRTLGRMFHISRATARQVVTRTTWKHLD